MDQCYSSKTVPWKTFVSDLLKYAECVKFERQERTCNISSPKKICRVTRIGSCTAMNYTTLDIHSSLLLFAVQRDVLSNTQGHLPTSGKIGQSVDESLTFHINDYPLMSFRTGQSLSVFDHMHTVSLSING